MRQMLLVFETHDLVTISQIILNTTHKSIAQVGRHIHSLRRNEKIFSKEGGIYKVGQ